MSDNTSIAIDIPLRLPVTLNADCRKEAIAAALGLALRRAGLESQYDQEQEAFEISSVAGAKASVPAKLYLFPYTNGFLLVGVTDIKVTGLRKSAMACFVNRVNSRLRLGNFDFNPQESVISFRLMQLCMDCLPTPCTVITCVTTACAALNRYVPEFRAVADSEKSPAQAAEDALLRTKENQWTLPQKEVQ